MRKWYGEGERLPRDGGGGFEGAHVTVEGAIPYILKKLEPTVLLCINISAVQ